MELCNGNVRLQRMFARLQGHKINYLFISSLHKELCLELEQIVHMLKGSQWDFPSELFSNRDMEVHIPQ